MKLLPHVARREVTPLYTPPVVRLDRAMLCLDAQRAGARGAREAIDDLMAELAGGTEPKGADSRGTPR